MKKATKSPEKPTHVMVTFGRGTAELKKNFDAIAKKGNYTKAGLALKLIAEGVARRMGDGSGPSSI